VVSPKGTVPVLVLTDGTVIDESLDIMRWALEQRDPKNWLAPGIAQFDLIAVNDGLFKFHLDRMKYSTRYPGAVASEHRVEALKLLLPLEHRLREGDYLFGSAVALADVAVFPFVRQFANAMEGSLAAELPLVSAWLARWEASALFQAAMTKYSVWKS
jgi:glutathione S-transferase